MLKISKIQANTESHEQEFFILRQRIDLEVQGKSKDQFFHALNLPFDKIKEIELIRFNNVIGNRKNEVLQLIIYMTYDLANRRNKSR